MKMKISSTAITLSVSLFLAISTTRVAPAAQTIKTILETQKLVDGQEDDRFGKAVSISGNLAIIGALNDDVTDSSSGSAFVYAFNGMSWNQQAKLVGSDEGFYSVFGTAVAISGNVALVGAPGDNTLARLAGTVYVFTSDGQPGLSRPSSTPPTRRWICLLVLPSRFQEIPQ